MHCMVLVSRRMMRNDYIVLVPRRPAFFDKFSLFHFGPDVSIPSLKSIIFSFKTFTVGTLKFPSLSPPKELEGDR